MKKLMYIVLALLLVGCEKSIIDEKRGQELPADANVVLHFVQYQQEAFTRSATDITNLCSRLNIPITRNQVTRYTGSFFGSGGTDTTSSGTFRLTADPDWAAVNGYTF